MLSKAKQLLHFAKQRQHNIDEGKNATSKCPYKRNWGLQYDGDLWEIGWNAILSRGAASQDIRKVKGHATDEMVQTGQATAEDKRGNSNADEVADYGATQSQGRLKHLAELFSWRHVCYRKLARIQHFIVELKKIKNKD